METLKFKMTSNGNEVIKFESNYVLKDNNLSFKESDTLYKIDLEKEILFKENNESKIMIDFLNQYIIISIKEQNGKVTMDLDKSSFKMNKNHLELEYSFLSDEQITNYINIEY